jgi:methionyl-tRNA formyltransferase
MNIIKTLFIGSNWESVETLKTLHNDNRFEIIGVITQTDKPSGRKQELTPTLVKQYALDNNIPVFITENKSERYQEALDLFKPELVVVKAFGEIIPEFFLNAPKYKCINIHFSILPKYRGAVPIQMAILNGETETGVSYMLMSAGMDEGDVLKITKENILPDDTNLSLRKRLVEKSASEMPSLLIDWVEGKIQPVKQDSSLATYCYQKQISKENAQIHFDTMEAVYIERFVRALIPWPVAWCMFEGKRMKVLKAKISNHTYTGVEEYKVIDKNLVFKTKDGFIELLEIQLEGRNPVLVQEFINSLN